MCSTLSPKAKTLRHYANRKKGRKSRGSDLQDMLLREPHEPQRACQTLWRAVLTQMMTDAISRSGKPEAVQHRREARRWIHSFSRDFRMVCYYAGYDPRWVREKMEAFLTRHDAEETARLASGKPPRNPLPQTAAPRFGLSPGDFSGLSLRKKEPEKV